MAAIAKEINILPDSFVFMDDNPAEREIVRQELPGRIGAGALPRPRSISARWTGRAILKPPPFPPTTASAAEMYRQNLQRAAWNRASATTTTTCAAWRWCARWAASTTPHAERITQLINKTNQFNLTTRRYTAAEVEALMDE